jgi:diaminopimelate epimerase
MHGLGNDFIIINNLELQHQFTAEEISYLANRKFGIGCDQLLIIDRPNDGVSDFYYRIYNSDGSIAGQCGNGARCFIRYVIQRRLTNKTTIQLQTKDRVILGQILENGLIEVDMGIAEFAPHKIPLKHAQQRYYEYIIDGKSVKFQALSMGNPHAVITLNNPEMLSDDEYMAKIGQTLQNSPLFPDSVNVNFIVKINETTLHLRTYERGCGFTLACGSGACASAVAALSAGIVNAPVKLIMPSGELVINLSDSHVFMQGDATNVFDGTIEITQTI